MGRRATFSDEMILEAANKVKSDGKDVTGWTVHSELGGGRISRIERVLAENDVLVLDANPVVEQVLSLPSQFQPIVEDVQQAIHNAACQMWGTASEMADNRVKDEFAAAKAAKDKAEKELSEARQAVDQQEDELEKMEVKLEELQQENKTCRTDLLNANSKTSSLEGEVRNLKEQMSGMASNNKRLEKELKEAQEAVAEMRGSLKTSKEQEGLLKQFFETVGNNNKLP